MKKVKKDLQTVTKELKILTKRVRQLTTKVTKTAVGKLEHAQAAIKLKSPAQHAAGTLKAFTRQTEKLIKAVDKFEKKKATTKRKVKANTRPAKKGHVQRPAVKKPVAKKAKTLTATDHVIKIIGRSKKGVDVPTLMQKTGFDETKVRNIVFKAAKQGKVQRVGRGIYLGA